MVKKVRASARPRYICGTLLARPPRTLHGLRTGLGFFFRKTHKSILILF